MKQSTQDEAKGKFHEVKGKVKEGGGKATNNPRLQDEGTDEKVAGVVQKKIGQVQKVFDERHPVAELGVSSGRGGTGPCALEAWGATPLLGIACLMRGGNSY